MGEDDGPAGGGTMLVIGDLEVGCEDCFVGIHGD